MTGPARTIAALCIMPLALSGCGRDEAKEKALTEQVAAAEARADAAERRTKEYAAALEKLRAPTAVTGPAMSLDAPDAATDVGGSGDAPMNTEQPFNPQGTGPSPAGPAPAGQAQADASTPHSQS